MANEKKLTKREKFEMIAKITEVAENPILAEFVEHELELLAKKNASGSGKLTATQKANEELKNAIVEEFARTKGDTGSVEVQVAILTERINILTEHMKEHSHDYHTNRGLLQLVGKRKSLLEYLKNEDVQRYRDLIKKLNLRK